jgi:uncharacterized protein DUF2442
MASIAKNSGPRSASYGTGDASVSIVGGVTAPRPRPSEARARIVKIAHDELRVELIDGRKISVPLAWYPRLIEASPRERRAYQLIGDGRLIHWPAVDEDIDVANLLREA